MISSCGTTSLINNSNDVQGSLDNIIPKPVSVIKSEGKFIFDYDSDIYVDKGNPEIALIAQYLAEKLKPSTGYNIFVIPAEKIPDGNIYLTTKNADQSLGEEGYEIIITENLLTLKAYKPAGLFRGVQTIRQIFSPLIDSRSPQNIVWEIPTGVIRDYPRFEWRGVMLDVARHFFTVEDVKRYIDLVAYYKINRFHIHLADDQGWRILINSWPNLAVYGGSTEVGGGEGGYYTQSEYAEIVKYASERYITIVPEIDMPGHTNAALASYRELNKDGIAPPLYTGIQVGLSALDVRKELTYKFIDDVIRELAALTPGEYIHVGGDEAPKVDSADYHYFVGRVQEIVNSHGKKMVGWDEISIADLAPTTLVQHWRNKLIKHALEQNVKVIMSPCSRMYMDMKYDSTIHLGLSWAGYIEVQHGYDWDPTAFTEGITEENIIGIEAPLWAETITTIDDIEFLAFPRLPGYAEMGWTPASLRNWEEYKERLAYHSIRWRGMDINFYPSKQINWR